jgi:glycosyltransferase involved in cell wall biosynthesis
MRILLSCHRAEVGGIQTWMVGVARSYRARGHECELFFFDHGAFEPHLPPEIPAHFGDLADYLRLVRANRYDVVHACNMDWEFGVTAVRRLGARLVLTCHGWVSGCWNSTNCDAIVSCAGWNATAQEAVSDLPVRVVYNGIDLDRYSPPPGEAAGPPIVAWVGRGGALEQKRIDRLAAVAVRLAAAGVRVWIADPEGPARVPAEIAAALGPVAEFWGPVAPDRMADFFRQVGASGGCVLSTSTFEGLPLSLAEAQACGCPVIGPDVRGVNEVLDPRRGGVIHAADLPPEAVARLVLDALGDRAAMQTRREACRAFVAERFDHERMVAEYLDVYERALAAPQRIAARPAAGWFRALFRSRSRAYIEAYWAAGYAQLRASERLAASGDGRCARAAAASSWQTCPSLFIRPRRISHLVSTWWRAAGPGAAAARG